uniref:Uncharacterized protein n=1 Tax=Arion vulgaris TaxID=1028688 RepID=A0A0B6ZXQ3_9EUPU
MDQETDLLTLGQIQAARSYLSLFPEVVRTPLLAHIQHLFVQINIKKINNDTERKCDTAAANNECSGN